MWEIQIFLLGVTVGWAIKTLLEAMKMQRIYRRVMRDISNMEVAERILDRVFKQCYIEKDGNSYYLYNDDNSSFMCQGSSYEDLAKCLYTQHEIQIALVRKENEQHCWFDHDNIKPVEVKNGN